MAHIALDWDKVGILFIFRFCKNVLNDFSVPISKSNIVIFLIGTLNLLRKFVRLSHRRTSNHTINYNETKVIAKEKNYKQRLFKETVYININSNTVNHRFDIENISVLIFITID